MAFVAGCGGLAAEALHFSGEFVGKFKKDRRALPVMALGANPSVVTAIANDFSFDVVYARELEAFAHEGDIFIALSTSGKSKIILNAIQKANDMGLITIDFPREGFDVPQIQENQLKLLHKIALEVEEEMFP